MSSLFGHSVHAEDLGTHLVDAVHDPIQKMPLPIRVNSSPRLWYSPLPSRRLQKGSAKLAPHHTGVDGDLFHLVLVMVRASMRLHDDLLRCPRHVGDEAEN